MYKDITVGVDNSDPEQTMKKIKIMHKAVMICL